MQKIRRAGPSARAAAAAAALLALSACSQAAPRIASVSLRLVQTGGADNERLSLFVLAEDDDGEGDLDELYLVHDGEQLSWKLTGKDWVQAKRAGRTWYGSHALAAPPGASLPRGEYRVVLADKGGSRAERRAYLDVPVRVDRPFPRFVVKDGNYRIESTYARHQVVAYDAAGKRLRASAPPAMAGRVADLGFGSQAASFALLAEDEAGTLAAFTDPVPLD